MRSSFLPKLYLPVSFIAILAVAFFLRVSNRSIYKFYPDSYQSLVVADNIKNYGSVVGRLGTEGVYYPDFFPWTRPMYPLVIDAFRFIQKNTADLALNINLVSGLGIVLAAFFLIKQTTNSNNFGLIAAILAAVGFNLVVWSGFIFTEPVAILLQMLTLLLVFAHKDSSGPADPHELALGFALALSVLARYEYIILFLPVLFWLYSGKKNFFWTLANIFSTFALVIAVCYYYLGPLPYDWGSITSTFTSFWPLAIIGLCTAFCIWKFRDVRFAVSWAKFALVLFMIVAVFLIPGLGDFFRNDFLLGILFFTGLGIMAWKNTYDKEFFFAILGILQLGAMYYMTNPDIQRYWTNTWPFLLVVAVIPFRQKLLANKKILAVFTILLLAQIYYTYLGMKKWDRGIWFEKGYEQQAAETANQYLTSSDILLVSFPETYYYFTKHSTYSLTDTKPFVYIPAELDSRDIVVVDDQGLHDIFPHAQQAFSALSAYKIGEFRTNLPYRYADRIENEKQPVAIYRLKVETLKKLLTESKIN